jgi:hypothetical protein
LDGTRPDIEGHLSELDDQNVWLGRSNYQDDEFMGTFDEFRIYDAALSADELAESYRLGPKPEP